MKTLLTEFPIHSHTGIEIVPEGTVINKKLLHHVQNMVVNRKMFSIADIYSTDISQILQKDVYEVIFREKEAKENIFSVLDRITLPSSEIEAIEYIKDKDFYVYEHLLTVFSLSVHFTSLLKKSNDSLASFKGSLSHDIGKVSVPVSLLHKNTPLTKIEHEHIKNHTLAGNVLLNYYTGLHNCTSSLIARDHHEKTNGTGYPSGRKNLDFYTQIVIVCDIYDALLSPRSYRKEPFNNRTALEELTKKAIEGTLSKTVVKALIAENRRTKIAWHECDMSNDFRGIYPKMNNYGKISIGR